MRHGGGSFIKTLDPTGIDVLVLAGDIAGHHTIAAALKKFCAKYKRVVFVPGNHEFYGSDPLTVWANIERTAKSLPNLSVLRYDRVVEVDGLTIIGDTMWFPYDAMNQLYEHAISDFELIKKLAPWVYEENARFLSWLAEAPKADVVVTHHVPAEESIASSFRGSQMNRFFLCNVRGWIVQAQPKLWLHGHTHTPLDYKLGETRVLCSPLGYPNENKHEKTYKGAFVDL